MRSDDFQALLGARPFQAFGLHLTNGQVFEIRHPELVVLSRSLAWIHIPAQSHGVILGQSRIAITLLHIVHVDFVEAANPLVN